MGYPKRVAGLEKDISRHLGTDFTFDARSGLEDECSAECRLGTVGRFLENLLAWRGEPVNRLRVLMLEDFHITPLDGWTIGSIQVDSEDAAEEYLRQQMPLSEHIAVKLIHTYDEWTTPGGITVQLGAGLSKAHFNRAAAFLGADVNGVETSTPNDPPADGNGVHASNGYASTASSPETKNGKRKQDEDAPESPRPTKVMR